MREVVVVCVVVLSSLLILWSGSRGGGERQIVSYRDQKTISCQNSSTVRRLCDITTRTICSSDYF